ncbi:hypothetical protein Tco_0412212 [Tanacetum coccineum]
MSHGQRCINEHVPFTVHGLEPNRWHKGGSQTEGFKASHIKVTFQWDHSKGLMSKVQISKVGDVVDAPNPSTYEVGGPSMAIVAQPQVIDDLYREMDNLRERQGALARTMVDVSDIEATNNFAIGETYPRVTALEEQVQTLQTALHENRSKNQQLQTTVAEMHSHEGTLMQYMQ